MDGGVCPLAGHFYHPMGACSVHRRRLLQTNDHVVSPPLPPGKAVLPPNECVLGPPPPGRALLPPNGRLVGTEPRSGFLQTLRQPASQQASSSQPAAASSSQQAERAGARGRGEAFR